MTTQELDAELAAIPDEQLAELVNKEVKHLCNGNDIHMSVPVSKYDGDMLFCELLRRFKALRQAAVTPALPICPICKGVASCFNPLCGIGGNAG